MSSPSEKKSDKQDFRSGNTTRGVEHPRGRAQKNVSDVNSYARWFALLPIVVIVLIAFRSESARESAQTVAFCIAIIMAAFAVGGIFGFLFGIPRQSIANTPEATSANATAATSVLARTAKPSTINTNLVQISDWLTKLLVGAALTQVSAIYSGFSNLVGRLAPYLGTAEPCDYASCGSTMFGEGIVGGLLLFGLIYGFMWGHLWTTLFLNVAYRDVEVIFKEDAEQLASEFQGQREMPEPATLVTSHLSRDAGTVQINVSSAARTVASDVASLSFNQLVTETEFLTWARAKLVLGRYDDAMMAYRRAIGMRPDDINLKIEVAQAAHNNRRHSAAARRYQEIASLLPDQDPRRHTARFFAALNSLYVTAPGGFNSALGNLESLKEVKEFQSNAHFWVLVACANGQAYRWGRIRRGLTDQDSEMLRYRQEVIGAIERVKKYDSQWLPFLQDCLRGKGSDNDLDAFKGDLEVRKALEMDSPAEKTK